MTRPMNTPRPAWCPQAVAVFAVCAIALLGIAAADAQPFTPQQLTVTVANGTATSGGNSIFVVPLGTNSSLITNTATPINTDRAQVGAIDALAWLPTGSQAALALAAADVKRRTILLYPNLASYPSPNYGVSTPLYVPLPVGKPCSGVPNAPCAVGLSDRPRRWSSGSSN